jgi:hypothetical protein
VVWRLAVVLEILTGEERRSVGFGGAPVASGGKVSRVVGGGDAGVSFNNQLKFVLWAGRLPPDLDALASNPLSGRPWW